MADFMFTIIIFIIIMELLLLLAPYAISVSDITIQKRLSLKAKYILQTASQNHWHSSALFYLLPELL